MKNKLFFIFISFFSFSLFSHAQNIIQVSDVTRSPNININNVSTMSIATSTNLNATTSEDKYVQIVNSCKFNFSGSCVSVRNGPHKKAKKIFGARNGIVLKVTEKITNTEGDWYKISFDGEKLIYPERVSGDMYVFANYATSTSKLSPELYDETKPHDETKSIIVDLSDQKLYAYQNDVLYMTSKVSTGLTDTPTTPNEYYIFYKTPSRYMQGPTDRKGLIKSYSASLYNSTTTSTSTRNYLISSKAYATDMSVKDYYDLPGVPYTMYFDSDGSAIHGAYWHNDFGRRHSHGCVNMSIKDSEKLYLWANAGTSVIIRK
jgi:hypothetical protein